jgi:outer membrane protein assembly factor BamB
MKSIATLVVVLALAGPPASDPWSRFRGPNGTGISETSDLPTEFGPTKNVVWKAPVPAGHSSPVLTPTHIFMTGVDGEKLVVFALDRASGKELWRHDVPRRQTGRLENVNGPASPSPVTDGTSVYAFFQDFGLIAFNAGGKELWRLPLGPFNMFYGFGASPIVVDGTVILSVDQDTGSYLLGVDAKSGKVRYKVDRPGVISGYSTPTVYQPKDGGTQVLIPESLQLSAYDVKDGHRGWWVRGLTCEM